MEEERNLEQFVEEYRSSVQANGGIEKRDSNPTVITWRYNGTDYPIGSQVTIYTDNTAKTITAGQVWTPSGNLGSYGSSNFSGSVISSAIFGMDTGGGSWKDVKIGIKENTTGSQREGSCRVKNSRVDGYFYITVIQGDNVEPEEPEEPTTYYTIRFITHPTQGSDVVHKTEALPAGSMPTPPDISSTRPGYDFVGWNPTVSVVVGNQDYYSVFEEHVEPEDPVSIKIGNTTYLGTDSTDPIVQLDTFTCEAQSVVIGQSFIPSTVTNSSWSVSGWSGASISISSTKGQWNDITLTLPANESDTQVGGVKHITINGYALDLSIAITQSANSNYRTLVFKDYDGRTISTVTNATLNSNTVNYLPTLPTRTGYTFKGWDPDLDVKVTRSRTYTAEYEENTGTTTCRIGLVDYWGGEEVYWIDASPTLADAPTLYLVNAVSQKHLRLAAYYRGSSNSCTLSSSSSTTRFYYTATGSYNTATTSVSGFTLLDINDYNVGSGLDLTLRFVDSGTTYGYFKVSLSPRTSGTTNYYFQDGSTWLGQINQPDGSTNDPLVESDDIWTLANPTKTGYTFNGWHPKTVKPSDLSQTFIATWQEDNTPRYTITFQDWDGTIIDTRVYVQGEQIVVPPNPTRDRYEFTGWSPNVNTTAVANQTYIAQYTGGNPTVPTVKINNREYTDTSSSITLQFDSSAITEFQTIGQSFIPSSEASGVWTTTIPSGSWITSFLMSGTKGSWQDIKIKLQENTETQRRSQSFYIKYNGSNLVYVSIAQEAGSTPVTTYTVTWQDWDGTILKTEQVNKNGSGTPPSTNPTRSGYRFTGWYPNPETTSIGSNTTFYAQYVKQYLQSFYMDDGVTLWREVWMDKDYNLTDSWVDEPTKSGYNFVRWNPTLPHLVSKDQTHIAVFEESGGGVQLYTVTFKDWDGTVIKTGEYEAGAELTKPGNNPTRVGYEFTGWSPEPPATVPEGGGIYTATYLATGSPTETPDVPAVSFGGTVFPLIYQYGWSWLSPEFPAEGTDDLTIGWSWMPTTYYNTEFTNTLQYGSIVKSLVMSKSPRGQWNPIKLTLKENTEEARMEQFNIGLNTSSTNAVTITVTLQQKGSSSIGKSYTITWKDWDGTVLKTESLTAGSTPTPPANPTRTGYQFKGWSPSIETVSGDKEYTATYDEITTDFGIIWSGQTTYFSSTEGAAHVYITLNGTSAQEDLVLNFTRAADDSSATGYSWSGDTDNASILGITPDTGFLNGDDRLVFKIGNGSEGTFVKSYKTRSTNFYIHIHITRGQVTGNYRIRFYKWENSQLISDVTIPAGSVITRPANPTSEGYSFVSWYPNDWPNGNETVTATKDQDYYGIWESTQQDSFTIVWKDWDGTELLRQQNIVSGTTPHYTNTTPTREGYVFTGWSPTPYPADKNETYVAQYEEDVTPQELPTYPCIKIGNEILKQGDSTTLSGYGPEENMYIIGYSFIPSDNINSWSNTLKYGSMISTWLMSSTRGEWKPIEMRIHENTTSEVRKETFSIKLGGNTFIGLTVSQNAGDGSGDEPSGDGPFTITFKDWNGTVIRTDSYAKGATITVPASPTRTGYTFTGWTPTVSSIAVKDQVYIATYIEGDVVVGEGEYLVRFLDWDGSIISAHRYDNGDTITKPSDPSRTGYIFTGWSPVVPSTCTKSADYTAQYTAKNVTVVFRSWDGALLSSKTYKYGTEIEVPTAPKRIHYKFKGWTPPISTIAVADVEYTAQYEYAEYTMTFIDWDGTVISSFTYTEGSIAAIPVPPERPGYKFLEWHLQSTDENGNMTYVAVYIETGIVIKWMSWDGSIIEEKTYSYAEDIVIPTPPIRPGYEFSEWVPTVDPQAHESKIYMASYRRIYTTKWNFTVDGVVQYSFDKTDVEKYFDQDYSKYEIAPSDGVKAGYLFQSWGGKGYELDEESKTKTWIFEGIFVQTGTIYRFYDADQRTILQQLTYAGIGGSNYDSYVNPAIPTKRNFKFTGWTLFKSEGNIYSYYAGWTPWGFKLNTRPNMSRNKYKYFLT